MSTEIVFEIKVSGILKVTRLNDGRLEMTFPIGNYTSVGKDDSSDRFGWDMISKTVDNNASANSSSVPKVIDIVKGVGETWKSPHHNRSAI